MDKSVEMRIEKKEEDKGSDIKVGKHHGKILGLWRGRMVFNSMDKDAKTAVRMNEGQSGEWMQGRNAVGCGERK